MKKSFESQGCGGFIDALLDISFRHLAKLQAECHVVENGHMWIKRVRLENHRDIAVFRRNVVDDPVANQNLAFADFFQTGQATQRRRLTAAGRTNQNEEFLILDFELDVLQTSTSPYRFHT